jgi:hypothetical protein
MDHVTLSEAPTQVGDPKWQRAAELELGSGSLTPKCPHMVVSRCVDDDLAPSWLVILRQWRTNCPRAFAVVQEVE